LMTRLNLPSEYQSLQPGSRHPQIIASPSQCMLKQSPSSSCKDEGSSFSTTPTSVDSSMQRKSECIAESLILTAPSKTRWPCKETYASLIIPNSSIYEQPSSPPLALVPISPHLQLLPGEELGETELEEGMIPVINGIEAPARSRMVSASLRTTVIGEDAEGLTKIRMP
jgi:hypothetical protein